MSKKTSLTIKWTLAVTAMLTVTAATVWMLVTPDFGGKIFAAFFGITLVAFECEIVQSVFCLFGEKKLRRLIPFNALSFAVSAVMIVFMIKARIENNAYIQFTEKSLINVVPMLLMIYAAVKILQLVVYAILVRVPAILKTGDPVLPDQDDGNEESETGENGGAV